MTKRKRRSNSTTSNKKFHHPNPFLKYVDGGQQQQQQKETSEEANGDDKRFDSFLSFMKLSKQKGDENVKSQMDDIVSELLSTLDTSSSSSEMKQGNNIGLISTLDVVSLLLPWAIKIISRSQKDPKEIKTQWRTLENCLKYLILQSESTLEYLTSNFLSLSTLNKLVPVAGNVAFHLAGIDTISETAGNCHCLLVNHFYSAPFDVVCDSLLTMVGDGKIRLIKSEDYTLQKMVLSTLRLLCVRIKKANSKKSFQLLVKPNIFHTLSDIYAQSEKWSESPHPLVKELLVHGLFDVDNHIDGFRSIKMEIPSIQIEETMEVDTELDPKIESHKKSDFHCYQEDLLALIQGELSTTKDGSASKKAEEVSSVIQLLPLLLESFIEQTLALQQQIRDRTSTNKKKASGNKIANLQFQFFAYIAGFLMKLFNSSHTYEMSRDQVRIKVLIALGKSLKLLLEHDIYLPSNEDINNDHFSFLCNLGRALIHKMKTPEQSNVVLSVDERENALAILDTLVRLNHLILHDQISEITAFCLTHIVVDRSWKSSKFLGTLIVTYKKLRQLDYFCSSFVEGVDLMRENNNVEGLKVMINLIQDPNICSSLSEAIRTSPINQVKDIVAKMNGWIIDLLTSSKLESADNDECRSTLLSLSTVVQAFVILIENVSVAMNSSQELYPLCEDISSGAVNSLLVKYREIPSMTSLAKNGLLLFGWTMNLQNRCIFWMQNSADENLQQSQMHNMSEELLCILEEAMDSFDKSDLPQENELWGSSLLEELQFLACQRIHQLHSEMHDNRQIAFASDDLEYSNKNQLAEAKKLAQFALHSCIQDAVPEPLSRLTVLSKSIASWASYVDKEDMLSFLSKFFLELALHEPASQQSNLLLLEDAEFYETPNVAETLGTALLSCIAELSQMALRGCFKSKPFDMDVILCPIRHPSWTQASPTYLNKIVGGNLKITTDVFQVEKDERKKTLLSILHCLQRLKEMRASLWEQRKNAVNGFDALMRLDLAFRSLVIAESEVNKLTFEITSALREVASQILDSMSGDVKSVVIGDAQTFRILLENLSRTTMNAMETKTIDSHSKTMLLNSSQRLVGAIAEYSSRSSDLLTEFAKGVKTIFVNLKSYSSDDALLLSTTLGWYIVQKLIASDIPGEDSDSIRDSVADICTCIQNSVWKDALTVSLDQKPQTDLLKYNSVLMISELLKYSSVHLETSGWLTNNMKQSLGQKIVKKACLVMEKSTSAYELRSVSYLVACLALVNPPQNVRVDLANGIIGHLVAPNKVLESAFCTLIEGLETDSTRKVLSSLASFDVGGPQAGARLRLFRVLVLNLASSEKLPILSEMARDFFSLSLQSLVQRRCLCHDSPDQSVQSATALLIEMASNKDIISISERDIALILTFVNSAMNDMNDHQKYEFCPIENVVYDSCFSMLSFLLQRFPKQLHSCVSLTVSVIASIFQHTLYGKLQESEVVHRCQKFTRICELLLPHGDVYKKHVLNLLVEFVRALKADMDLKRKDCLSPAIYCLLDVLQQHETTQLNCMLDEMGRALLRSVHKNYQKLHVYKGQ